MLIDHTNVKETLVDKKKDTPKLSLFPELDPNSAILNAEEIKTMVNQGALIAHSTFDGRCLQSTSYDVRVGQKGIIGGEGSIIDLTKKSLIIQPGSYAGVISLEKIKLPNRVLAQIGSKRKLAYEGLILLTGAIVDPGYEGHLLFGLYNASTKKVVIPAQTKICNLTFILLRKEQEPVYPDPNLLAGDFPPDFVNNMANMDVMPWADISDEVKHIQKLAKDILELRQKYEDVTEPIKLLTTNVSMVSSDVGRLTHELKGLGEKVDKLDDATKENARQLGEAIQGVRLLTSQVGDVKKMTEDHHQRITDIRARLGKYGVLLYIVGSILLLIVGALINHYLFPSKAQDKHSPPAVVAPQSPSTENTAKP